MDLMEKNFLKEELWFERDNWILKLGNTFLIFEIYMIYFRILKFKEGYIKEILLLPIRPWHVSQ